MELSKEILIKASTGLMADRISGQLNELRCVVINDRAAGLDIHSRIDLYQAWWDTLSNGIYMKSRTSNLKPCNAASVIREFLNSMKETKHNKSIDFLTHQYWYDIDIKMSAQELLSILWNIFLGFYLKYDTRGLYSFGYWVEDEKAIIEIKDNGRCRGKDEFVDNLNDALLKPYEGSITYARTDEINITTITLKAV